MYYSILPLCQLHVMSQLPATAGISIDLKPQQRNESGRASVPVSGKIGAADNLAITKGAENR